MVDVLKVFYAYHYNFAAVSVLLLLILIFLLSKKNFKAAPIVLVMLVALNIGFYKKTFNKAWTLETEPEKIDDGYANSYAEPKRYTFSTHNWIVVTDKGEKLHWCWVENLEQKIVNTDLVGLIWGSNASKKVVQATESRINDADNLDTAN